VLANFPVWCGAVPPQSVTVAPAQEDAVAASPEIAEQRLLASLNRDRLAAGLAALTWDDRVAGVARGHSNEMHRTHIVAHVSPTTGSAADRVRTANIKTGVVLENVARAYGVNEAHDGLMNSPGHRANMMSPAATHVGVGVAFGEEVSGRREMFVTQVFTRVPPTVDPAAAAEAVRQKLVAVRRDLVAAPALRTLAQQLAEALAAGQSREVAYGAIKPKLDGLGGTYLRVSSLITATADLDALDAGSLLGTTQARDIGIGITQGLHPEIGEHAIWIVVLLGERRPAR
jgi:hypothetical protein